MDDIEFESEIGALVRVGALDQQGAAKLLNAGRKMIQSAGSSGRQGASPAFGRSSRDTVRRAPLGFKEDSTGNSYFTLAAAVGATTIMRGKVSREAHVNRLLIVPSATGVVIESMKIGDEEQCLEGGVPAELYGSTALTDTEPDNFQPLDKGLDFVITFKNTTAGAITGTIGCKASCKR